MHFWKCKPIFTSDTQQQNIEITDLKPHFLAGENTSALMVLASTVSILQDRYAHPYKCTEFNDASVRSVWALEGLGRRRRRNLHFGKKQDGHERWCEWRWGMFLSRGWRNSLWEGGRGLHYQSLADVASSHSARRESDEPSTPSGEIHLHNLCQQVPNGPKNQRGREERAEKTLTK